jgi:hypothetical protein
MIMRRQDLSAPREKLIALHEPMIVPRGRATRILVEPTVLWPKRNSSKVGYIRQLGAASATARSSIVTESSIIVTATARIATAPRSKRRRNGSHRHRAKYKDTGMQRRPAAR